MAVRCTRCKSRIRPPKRPWAIDRNGKQHFYSTTTRYRIFEAALTELNKRIPFIHRSCLDNPDSTPRDILVAETS